MAALNRSFVHRWNADEGAYDSICSICHATVCRNPALVHVEECQKSHVCPASAIDRWSDGVWQSVSSR